MEIFVKIFNGYKSFAIFVTSSILDILQDSEYISAINSTRSPELVKF